MGGDGDEPKTGKQKGAMKADTGQGVQSSGEDIRVQVTQKKDRLEEKHRKGPDRSGSPEPRKDELRVKGF